MPTQITTTEAVQGANDKGFGQQHIVETSTGILYAAEFNQSNGVSVFKSINGGTTWTSETTFSSLTSAFHLSMCVSELDDIFLCFVHNTTTIVIKKRDHTTATWSEVLNQVSATSSGAAQHAIICYGRSTSTLYVFYNTGANDVGNKRSTDYGGSFSSASSTGQGSGGSNFAMYSVAPYPNGNLEVIWAGAPVSGVSTSIFVAAGTWSSSGNTINATAASVYAAQMSINSTNNRWRAYYNITGGNYHLRVDKDNASSLDVNYSAVDTLLHGSLAFGVDNADNVYLFYVKISDSSCYYRKFTASTATWGSEILFSAADGIRPSCVQYVRAGGTKLRILYTTL